jgi:hypothetical protein
MPSRSPVLRSRGTAARAAYTALGARLLEFESSPFALVHPRRIFAVPPFAPATAGRRVHPRNVLAFALELPPFALASACRLIFSRNVLVQSSRLERVRFVGLPFSSLWARPKVRFACDNINARVI